MSMMYILLYINRKPWKSTSSPLHLMAVQITTLVCKILRIYNMYLVWTETNLQNLFVFLSDLIFLKSCLEKVFIHFCLAFDQSRWRWDIGVVFLLAAEIIFTMSIIVIRWWSVSPLPYDLGSPYLFHTLIILCACQAGMCHLILTSFSFSQSTDFWYTT